ncbi:hypothetical protein EVAR_5931_1 [Eumeta japonica]|uniref:Uncharacterized protein n=1 Tax=Eumeta variegata TaxID=151549 RepID=A0A4C1TFB9_EUMVA|nr:hypothetical protein EVAR_5931_1 [Eumeta japonica]
MVKVPAFTTYCGLGAEQIGPITAISSSCANPFASDPRSFVGAAISVISTSSPQFKRPKTVNVPDFNQPKNQVQADFEWRCRRMWKNARRAPKLLMELGVNKLGKPEKFFTSALDPESGSSYDDSEFSDDDDAEYYVTSAKRRFSRIYQTMRSSIAASVRLMEAEMDVDHEKLLSGDVNFKWQRDFTAFTAVRSFLSTVGAVKDYDSPYDAFIDIFDVDIMKEIVIETNRYAHQTDPILTKCLHTDNDKQPLPNAKNKQPLAASNQPVTDCYFTKFVIRERFAIKTPGELCGRRRYYFLGARSSGYRAEKELEPKAKSRSGFAFGSNSVSSNPCPANSHLGACPDFGSRLGAVFSVI